MFSKETYIQRRNELKKLVGEGVVVLFGNNESPNNYPNNAYYPFRQDSSFLYYFGQQRDGLVGVIDIDNDRECLIGDDIDIEDIVWYGSVESVADLAAQVGVAQSAPMAQLKTICDEARAKGRTIHFLPPYRHDIKIQIMDLLGLHPSEQKKAASMKLIQAVVKMRSAKTQEEIEELERAAEIGYMMHTTAMRLIKPGVTEKYIAGQVDGIAHSYGAQVSFATIFSQHGEIMHGAPSLRPLEAGRLALCDCGAETVNNYCSDNTRTMPVSGKLHAAPARHLLDCRGLPRLGLERCQARREVHGLPLRRMPSDDRPAEGARPDEGRHRGGCARRRPRHVPAPRTGPHDGHGRARHGELGPNLRGLRRGDTPQPRPVWHQRPAHGAPPGGRLRGDRRAGHLLHSRTSSTTGARAATARSSSASTKSRPTRTSAASASRTTSSSPRTAAASSARSAYPIIRRTWRSLWQP